jgi:hypothetical protein
MGMKAACLELVRVHPVTLLSSYCHITMPPARSTRNARKKTPYAKPGATTSAATRSNGKTISPEPHASTMGPGK